MAPLGKVVGLCIFHASEKSLSKLQSHSWEIRTAFRDASSSSESASRQSIAKLVGVGGAGGGQARGRVERNCRRAVNGDKSEWRVVEEAHSPLALGAILDSARTAFAPYHPRFEATHPTNITRSAYLDSFSSSKSVLPGCSSCASIYFNRSRILRYQVAVKVGHGKLMPRATSSKPLGMLTHLLRHAIFIPASSHTHGC